MGRCRTGIWRIPDKGIAHELPDMTGVSGWQ